MSLTRRHKLLDRTTNARDAKIYIIATEGAATEKVYFEAFNPPLTQRAPFEKSPIRVKVLPPIAHHSSPADVLAQVKEFTRAMRLDPRDEIWLVLDVDRWPEYTLARISTAALRGRYNVAISNPCFELWLCYHLEACPDGDIIGAIQEVRTNHSAGKNLKRLLRQTLGSYNEAKPDMTIFLPLALLAIERAKAVEAKTHPVPLWPVPLGTRVYKLVESLLAALEG